MRWLVTAGGTVVPIDKVRSLANTFTGRTGTTIALEVHRRGHDVTLLTSNPQMIPETTGGSVPSDGRWHVRHYRTFDELRQLMAEMIGGDAFDCVVQSAAISDFLAAGVFAAAPGTTFDDAASRWRGHPEPRLLDRSASKVKSDEPELWLRLVRAPKLIDLIRTEWGHRGVLVKFKLETDVGDPQLLAIAERSRRHSNADLMVANSLEGLTDWAYVGPLGGQYERVSRAELPRRLVEAVERLHSERDHG